jgi:hypothetical protein
VPDPRQVPDRRARSLASLGMTAHAAVTSSGPALPAPSARKRRRCGSRPRRARQRFEAGASLPWPRGVGSQSRGVGPVKHRGGATLEADPVSHVHVPLTRPRGASFDHSPACPRFHCLPGPDASLCRPRPTARPRSRRGSHGHFGPDRPKRSRDQSGLGARPGEQGRSRDVVRRRQPSRDTPARHPAGSEGACLLRGGSFRTSQLAPTRHRQRHPHVLTQLTSGQPARGLSGPVCYLAAIDLTRRTDQPVRSRQSYAPALHLSEQPRAGIPRLPGP